MSDEDKKSSAIKATTLRIHPDLMDRLDALAKRRWQSRTNIVSQALTEWLDMQEGELK